MKTRFFSLFILFFPHFFAQSQNLVPNGSFEEFENGCPESYNEMPISWARWTGSGDSFSTCVEPENFTDSLGWAPWNGLGYQEPYDGESYVGFSAFGPQDFSSNYREYLGCELIAPLEVGQTYYVSFKTSLAFGNYFYHTLAGNKLGVYFTNTNYDFLNNPLPIPNFAHVYEENIIADTTNWVTISGSFVADQPYSHMGIGVFFEFALLDTVQIVSGPSAGSYYYADDVCVSLFPECEKNTGLRPHGDLGLKIFPNPATGRFQVVSMERVKQIRVINMQGREVMRIDQPNSTYVQVETGDLPVGIYHLEVQFEQYIKREKLVVAR